MRKCNVCQVEQELDNFHNCKSFPLGKVYTCKTCAKTKSVVWNKANKIKKAETNKRHYLANKACYLKRSKDSQWAKTNREKSRLWFRQYYADNPDVYFNTVVMRRKTLKLATPKWLSQKQLEDMKRIYRLSARVTKESGKSHHVDHIVPIKGKNVCGLNVPWNLRVIPATMNIKKGNKYDSWNEGY